MNDRNQDLKKSITNRQNNTNLIPDIRQLNTGTCKNQLPNHDKTGHYHASSWIE